MKLAVIPLVVAVAVISPACSIQSPLVSSDEVASELPDLAEQARETLLLVSLEDGSIIKQTISSSADICFKKNSDSATTCLTQGAPIFSQDTDTVIGFEMIEDHIDLIAKSE